MAITIATVGSAWLISQAEGTPAATAAKGGNAMTATATIIDGPPNDDAEIVVRITGQITSSHQYGPRHCRKERSVWASATSVAGAPWGLGDADRATDKNGRFTFTQIKARYGGTAQDGTFFDGPTPVAGGPVTIQLFTSGSDHAPKFRGDILDSYRCRNVATSVTVQAPPQPQY